MKLNNELFMRNYELLINTEDKKGEALKIVPPFRISFDISKSTDKKLNKGTIKIYNLSETTRNQLLKDEDEKKYMQVILKCGYSELGDAFKGDIYSSYVSREGTDIVITLNCIDGGYDLVHSHTCKTVKSKKESVNTILEDMPHIKKGFITKQIEGFRPRVLVGNSSRLLESIVRDGELFFFENEKAYIVKKDEPVSDLTPLISSSTGMIGVPTEKQKKIVFNTLINTDLRLHGLCKIESQLNKRINGIYLIDTIKYKGDFDGGEWSQTVQCKRHK